MIPLYLAAWSLLLALMGPKLLRIPSWQGQCPRLGILAWQAMSVSFTASLILSGASLAVASVAAPGRGYGDTFWRCLAGLADAGHSPSSFVATLLGTVLVFGIVGRIVWSTLGHVWSVSCRRRRHVQALLLLGERRVDLGALVLAHPERLAYCVPGHRRLIVITTGALAALTTDQTRAVLAHERAHLRERHHLAVASARVLHNALPRVPLLQNAAEAVPRLVEMAADDHAGSRSSRRSVAEALVALTSSPSPVGSLAIGDLASESRLCRLMLPARSVPGPVSAVAALIATLLLVVPIGIFGAATADGRACPSVSAQRA